MAAKLQALSGKREMALGRCRNVNNIGSCRLQHVLKIGETCLYFGSLPQLFRHQQLAIAQTDDDTIRDAPDSLHMLVGNLSATDERDPEDARGCSLRAHNLEIRRQRSEVRFLQNERTWRVNHASKHRTNFAAFLSQLQMIAVR